jgi:hypothetical protein
MMRKILLMVLFTLTLFAANDSCKLDVYFGNGVDNDSKEAEASMEKLKKFMQLHYPSRFSIADEGVTYDFKYAHNETYGVINDLIETHWQLYESGQISKLYFSFVASALDSVDNTNASNNAYLQRVQNIINQYELDTATMLDKYRTNSFNSKHNVLLVAHSQGNLFGNKMYELLSSDEKDKFAMVSVATPANSVAKGGGYTTLHNDWVIKGIPNSLSSNANGSGHSFVESYLNNPIYSSVEAIALNINNAVNLIDQNSCAQYKHFRWISYMCSTRQSTELEVDIYGSKIINDYGMTKEELVVSDKRERVVSQNGSCPLNGWDYRTSVSAHDKNGCSAYTFDDTSGNYHSLDYIAAQTYDNDYTCTQYNMDSAVTEKLRSLQ